LATAAYQGECASLLVRGDGQLALKAKQAQEDVTHFANTKRGQIHTLSVRVGIAIGVPIADRPTTTITQRDGQSYNHGQS